MTTPEQPYFQRPPGWRPDEESKDEQPELDWQYPAPAPRHPLRTFAIVTALVAVVLVVAGVVAWQLTRPSGAEAAAVEYVDAMAAGDCERVTELSTDRLLEVLPDCGALPEMPMNLVDVSTDVVVVEEGADSARARATLEALGASVTMMLDLVQVDSEWLVDDVSEPEIDPGPLGGR